MELQQQELASVQLLGASFLTLLQQQLQDYRRHFEPQVLPLALNAWRALLHQLLMVDALRDSGFRGSVEAWLPSLEFQKAWRRRTLDALTALHEQQDCESPSSALSGSLLALSRSPYFGGGSFEGKTSPDGEGSLFPTSLDVVSAAENWVWVARLPAVLRGPSLLHDLQRSAVFQTLAAAASRCLAPALAAARSFRVDKSSASWRLRELAEQGAEAADPAELQRLLAESELEQGRLLEAFERGVQGLVAHVQSELLLYSHVFEPLLPLRGEHALLVLSAARALLAAALRQLFVAGASKLETLGEEVSVPLSGGGKLLSALETFEKLQTEVRLTRPSS